MIENLELHTERLLLRKILISDAESVFHYRSDSLTNKYQNWIPKTIEDVSEFIKNKVSSIIDIKGTWYQLVIIIKESGELIGDAGMHFYDSENQQVELGCTLDKKYQGQGFASEAMDKIIKFLFTKMNKHRIIASMDPRNLDSIKLVERLGLRRAAHFKESILSDGVWVDDLIYAISQNEWIKKMSTNQAGSNQ